MMGGVTLFCILWHFSHSVVSVNFPALDDEEFFVIEGTGAGTPRV